MSDGRCLTRLDQSLHTKYTWSSCASRQKTGHRSQAAAYADRSLGLGMPTAANPLGLSRKRATRACKLPGRKTRTTWEWRSRQLSMAVGRQKVKERLWRSRMRDE